MLHKNLAKLGRGCIGLLVICLAFGLKFPINRANATSLASPLLSTVTYDDNAIPPVAYTGNWTFSSTSANAMSNTLHWSNVSGDKATFSFNGSTITRFYSMANNRGSDSIYIDGVYKETASNYAPEVRRQVARTWNVPAGNHTIEVRVNGGFVDVDAFAVDIATVGTGMYDNSHAQIRYFGSWADSTYTSGTYNNSLKVSNTAQSGFRFTFTGNEITYIYSTASNRGIAAITIDGSNYGYIDEYSSDQRRQIGTRYTGLGAGVHVLNVVVTGTKNTASSDFYVDVDAVKVGSVYNRTAAVNYANAWSNNSEDDASLQLRNPGYPNDGTGLNCIDCTNYVSQVLENGGIPQIKDTAYNNNYYWYTYWWIWAWYHSDAWGYTPTFKDHADASTYKYQYIGGDPSTLEAGDFFVMDLRDDPQPDHARIIVGLGEVQAGVDYHQTRLLANQHCSDRWKVKWDYKLNSNVRKWAFHVVY